MAKITIRIPRDPNKPRTVAVDGVKGTGCHALTEGIEKLLGGTTSDETTGEYYEQEEQHEYEQEG